MKRLIRLFCITVKVKGACDHQANKINTNHMFKTTSNMKNQTQTILWQATVGLHNVKIADVSQTWESLVVLRTGMVQKPIVSLNTLLKGRM